MKKAKKIEPVRTYAPVWTDTMQFHLHPTCDRTRTKPRDEKWGDRTLTFIPVLIVPITPKRRKTK